MKRHLSRVAGAGVLDFVCTLVVLCEIRLCVSWTHQRRIRRDALDPSFRPQLDQCIQWSAGARFEPTKAVFQHLWRLPRIVRWLCASESRRMAAA